MNSTSQKQPLRWFLLLWLGLVSIQGFLVGGSGPRLPTGNRFLTGIDPGQFALAAFIVLMALHCALHGVVLFRKIRRGFLLPYFLGQGALVLLILYLADRQWVVFGLCLALSIEAISLLKWSRPAIIVVGGYIVLYALSLNLLNYLTTNPQGFLSVKLIDSLTLILFIIACVILYMQQAQAHKRDQVLLRELEVAHTQLANTHAQLEAAHIQLEDYAAQVEDLTLVTERQRLARELHDTLAQGLVGLTMQLETVDSLLAKQRCDQAREIVQQVMARARATMTDARSAIDDLRRETARPRDLSEAMQEALQRFTATTGIPCTSFLAALPALPTVFHEPLLHLVTEGLANIASHAQASQAWVRAAHEHDTLMLEVGDNGVGFDTATVAELTGHYGLLGLRERAHLVGGQLDILSAPGAGTTLRLQLPGANGGQAV